VCFSVEDTDYIIVFKYSNIHTKFKNHKNINKVYNINTTTVTTIHNNTTTITITQTTKTTKRTRINKKQDNTTPTKQIKIQQNTQIYTTKILKIN